MSGPPPKLGAERTAKDHRDGRLLVGSGVTNLVLTLAVLGLLIVVVQLSGANSALVDALSQQREQFTACEGKPAGTRGCTQPVAAEPSVIIKQGKRGPMGLTGGTGPAGPIGPTGPAGPIGPVGKTGPPPACAQVTSACVGAQGERGPEGPAGKDGAPGKDGVDGVNGKDGVDGKDGAQGVMGVQGPKGVGTSSTQCVDDDTPNGSHWLITYSDGTQETSPGPCRTKLP